MVRRLPQRSDVKFLSLRETAEQQRPRARTAPGRAFSAAAHSLE
jgi:hypothetical protein